MIRTLIWILIYLSIIVIVGYWRVTHLVLIGWVQDVSLPNKLTTIYCSPEHLIPNMVVSTLVVALLYGLHRLYLRR